MKSYSSIISLNKNSRGIYGIDTIMGCSSGMANEVGGCYNDCYAAKSAKIYGYDFSKSVLRNFKNKQHEQQTILQISRIKSDFIRVGCSGDPSENWEHTVKILRTLAKGNKEIVIITKHWTQLADKQLDYLSTLNLCINTSVSALDKPELLTRSLNEYHRIKTHCKSVLRIVSCNFNLNNTEGHRLHKIQNELFKNESTLDTIFRPNKNNPLVINGIINVAYGNFLGTRTLMSKFNKKTYAGKCSTCHELCGVSINTNHTYINKPGVIKQLSLL